MTERPVDATELLPERETPPAAGERTVDDYAVGERVVVFAPMGNRKRDLKRGTIEHINPDTKRARVALDFPPPRVVHSETGNVRQGTFSASVDQPILMKETDYERLHRDRTASREWVTSGYMDNERLRAELQSKLSGIGVCEAPSSFPSEAKTS